MKRKIILLIPMMLFVLAGLFGCKDNNFASSGNNTTASNAVQTNTNNSSPENTQEFVLPEIDRVSYTTLTSGRYTENHYSHGLERFDVGTVIEAYPLNFTDAFNNVPIKGTFGLGYFIGERYEFEWVSFSGYLLREPKGYTTIRESMDTEDTPRVIIQEEVKSVGLLPGDNIREEYGWTAKHGDFVTVVGQYRGYYNNEYGNFLKLIYVFLVEES